MKARYISRKAFKYNAEIYYPGMEWKPRGGKHDQKIIRSNFVRLVTEPDDEEKEVVADDQIENRGLDVNQHNHRGGGKRGNRGGRKGVHPANDPRQGAVDSQ